MVWIITRKELLTNLLTLRPERRFWWCAVLLSGLTAFIGSVDFSLRMDAYRQEVRAVDANLDAAVVWQQVQPHFVLPPRPLDYSLPGGWPRTSTPASTSLYGRRWVDLSGGYGIVDSGQMKTLVQIDFTTVIAIILSFLAIALGYDTISGEREQGTLRQVMTNPIPRGGAAGRQTFGRLPVLVGAFRHCLCTGCANHAGQSRCPSSWGGLGPAGWRLCPFLPVSGSDLRFRPGGFRPLCATRLPRLSFVFSAGW